VAGQKVVLADASPLIGLARIGRLGWLRKLYGPVFVTRAVRAEISVRGQPGAEALRDALRGRWIRQVRSEPKQPKFVRLDVGEASLLRAAVALGDRALVLLDDAAARREARRLGIAFVGTAGVIVEARRAGLIEKASPEFARLTAEGFHLGEALVQAILAELGET
jgi:predicted nucleic acid-binding protein